MQLYPNRLAGKLQQGLSAVYLIFGDEPQQKLEAIDLIRQYSTQQGFDERQSLVADSQFDWSTLLEASQSLSLFASRQLIELELPTGKPGTEGGKLLQQLAQQTNPDTIYLLHGPKIGKDVQKAKWFKALDEIGIYVPCYPLEGKQLLQWVQQRLQQQQLQFGHELTSFISDSCEGNLLAARQEIEKLALLYPDTYIELEMAQKSMVEHSRFNVFQLLDTLLAGDINKGVKILYRLENEGIEPNIVLWALIREWQVLYHLQFALSQGQALAQLWTKHRIWKNRQTLYQAALQRLPLSHLQSMQAKLSQMDLALKQSQLLRPYVELCHLCMLFMPAPLDAITLEHSTN